MTHPHPTRMTLIADGIRARVGERVGEKGAGLVLALVLELLLIAMVLTLGISITQDDPPEDALTSVDITAQDPGQPTPDEPEQAQNDEPAKAPPADQPPEPTAPEPEPVAPTLLAPQPQQSATPAPVIPTPNTQRKIRAVIRDADSDDAGNIGPVQPRSSSRDSERVAGSGPNGEPLYAASWYREPRDDELSGYLSTATGPGWGMIMCRTAPNYRVEDCEPVDEYPAGSNINRSILAAAWQFQVRPPRIGGKSMVGEWVRIRIDYNLRRR